MSQRNAGALNSALDIGRKLTRMRCAPCTADTPTFSMREKSEGHRRSCGALQVGSGGFRVRVTRVRTFRYRAPVDLAKYVRPPRKLR